MLPVCMRILVSCIGNYMMDVYYRACFFGEWCEELMSMKDDGLTQKDWQIFEMTTWYRLVIGQEASKRSMKHDGVSRYDKSQGWMGWERVHDMSWLPMNNDCMRIMRIVMSYWWEEMFWTISTNEDRSTTWTFIALKLHNTQICSLQGESENAYSVSQSAQSHIEHGYGK